MGVIKYLATDGKEKRKIILPNHPQTAFEIILDYEMKEVQRNTSY
jgi:hypothetical protein